MQPDGRDATVGHQRERPAQRVEAGLGGLGQGAAQQRLGQLDGSAYQDVLQVGDHRYRPLGQPVRRGHDGGDDPFQGGGPVPDVLLLGRAGAGRVGGRGRLGLAHPLGPALGVAGGLRAGPDLLQQLGRYRHLRGMAEVHLEAGRGRGLGAGTTHDGVRRRTHPRPLAGSRSGPSPRATGSP